MTRQMTTGFISFECSTFFSNITWHRFRERQKCKEIGISVLKLKKQKHFQLVPQQSENFAVKINVMLVVYIGRREQRN